MTARDRKTEHWSDAYRATRYRADVSDESEVASTPWYKFRHGVNHWSQVPLLLGLAFAAWILIGDFCRLYHRVFVVNEMTWAELLFGW